MSRKRERLYVGSRRYVAALDAQTGEEIWRTKFPSGSSAVVTMLLKEGRLFVGHSGHAYCLEAGTGAILWTNELPKMGYNPVMLAMEGAVECIPQGAATAGAEAEAAAAAACVVT